MATQDVQTTLNVDSRTTAGDIAKWLDTVPLMAKISVSHTPRDRPFDSEQNRIVARWTQSVKGT